MLGNYCILIDSVNAFPSQKTYGLTSQSYFKIPIMGLEKCPKYSGYTETCLKS